MWHQAMHHCATWLEAFSFITKPPHIKFKAPIIAIIA